MPDDRYGLRPLLERVLRDRNHSKDPEAWNQLLERLRALTRALLVLRVRDANDASDLAQDVQVRVIRNFDSFRGETVNALLAWVYKIAGSVLINYYRRIPRTCPLPADLPQQELPFDPDLVDHVLCAIDRLPEPGRSLIRGFYLEGRSRRQLALELNRGEVWVGVKKMLTVRCLRELLGDSL
jgi:RNA polymerase sigma factor (sigma-70 family)